MYGLYESNSFEKESPFLKIMFNKDNIYENISKITLKGFIMIILGKIFNLYFNNKHKNLIASGIKDSDFSKFQKIFEYIFNNVDKKISVTELSALSNLSTNYFSAYFKKVTGMSVQYFIFRIKMMRAKEFLRINKYPIKEVSYMLGYTDQNAFSKAFKRFYKVPPSDFT